MRYGEPSIARRARRAARAGVDRIVVFPLYPQYAASSTGSSVARVMELAAARWDVAAARRRAAVLRRRRASSTRSPRSRARARRRARPTTCCSRSTACPSARSRRATRRRALPRVGRLLRRDRAPNRALLPRAVLRDRARARARSASAIADYTVCVPVAARPHAVDQAVHRRRARRARDAGREAARRVLPGVRRRLPRDARGDRHPRARRSSRAAGGEELVLVPSLNATPRVGRRGVRARAAPRRDKLRPASGACEPAAPTSTATCSIVRPPVPGDRATRPARTTRARSRTSSTRRAAPTTSGSRSSTAILACGGDAIYRVRGGRRPFLDHGRARRSTATARSARRLARGARPAWPT